MRKVRLELIDGRVFEAEVDGRTFSCLADRFAFEKQFGVSSAVLGQWDHLFDEKGKPKEDADLSVVREEYLTFLYWRELRRRVEDVPEWAEVIAQAIEVKVIRADDALDPTGTDSTPTDS